MLDISSVGGSAPGADQIQSANGAGHINSAGEPKAAREVTSGTGQEGQIKGTAPVTHFDGLEASFNSRRLTPKEIADLTRYEEEAEDAEDAMRTLAAGATALPESLIASGKRNFGKFLDSLSVFSPEQQQKIIDAMLAIGRKLTKLNNGSATTVAVITREIANLVSRSFLRTLEGVIPSSKSNGRPTNGHPASPDIL